MYVLKCRVQFLFVFNYFAKGHPALKHISYSTEDRSHGTP